MSRLAGPFRFEAPRPSGPPLSLAGEALGECARPPVVLVHGFASSRRTNWSSPGWYRAFGEAGFSLIAFDQRGHAESDVSYEPEDYDEALMAGDIARAALACGTHEVDVFGYSMGAMTALALLGTGAAGVRVRRCVLAGLGANYFAPPGFAPHVPAALLADDPSSVTDAGARGFRVFADQQRQDRRALAACWQRPRRALPRAALAAIETPVLVVCGENDTITGAPHELAAALGRAEAAIVPGRDHMTAVGDRVTKRLVLDFLSA